MIDPDRFRITPVNKELSRVYKGNVLIGQVRKGLDGMWYPELVAERFHSAATHALMLAHEARTDFLEAVHGDR